MAKAPKPVNLTEDETLGSIKGWIHSIMYYLKQDKKFDEFLKKGVTWKKDSVKDRGLTGENADERADSLDNMLGFIAAYAPGYLTNQITKSCTDLNSIWQLIRKYYNIKQSETQFMKLANIRLEANERYEKFYHRILAHVQDNLLTTDSPLQYDGEKVDKDEVMGPTLERWVVLLWMQLIHEELPALVQRTFAYDLQRRTLKDLQPQICDAIDGFLEELGNNDLKSARSRVSSSTRFNSKFSRYPRHSPSRSKSNGRYQPSPGPSYPSSHNKQTARTPRKECRICRLEGRRSVGHSLIECDFLSTGERREIRANMVDIPDDHRDDVDELTDDFEQDVHLQNE